jgi:hypothetical protein
LLQEFAEVPGKEPPHNCPAAMYYWPELFTSMYESSSHIVNRRKEFLEREDTAEKLREWARYYFKLGRSIRRSTADPNDYGYRGRNVGDPGMTLFSQQLSLMCRAAETPMYAGDVIITRDRLTATICPGFIAAIDRPSLTLLIMTVDEVVLARRTDPTHVLAHAISATSNGLFVVVDFEFGLTGVYRLHYVDKQPRKVSLIVDFSWDVLPYSCASGVHALVASVVADTLVLWTMTSGMIHRVIKLGESIVAVAFDEEVGVWVATHRHGYFVSINGDIIAETEFAELVTALAALQLHRSQVVRSAIAGTVSGGVYLLHPLASIGRIDVVKLPSPHKHEIANVVVSPTARSFVTTDANEVCYMWTTPGVVGDRIRLATFARCAICNKEPGRMCASCGRAICARCVSPLTDQRCALCVSLDAY